MLATVNGEPRTFVTNVSVQMSFTFSAVMHKLVKEANEGRFATKGDAIQRRDELLRDQPGETVDSQATSASEPAGPAQQVEPAEQHAPADPDHYEDGQFPNDTQAQDVW